MSRQLINEYRAELDRLRAVTGSTRETNLRPAFARLLRAWGKAAHDLVFVEEHQLRTAAGNLISVDGALLHSLRVPFGYWEAKDVGDDLEAEIAAKFRRGYPRDNILFTDDRTAVLWQNGVRIDEAAMDDTDALNALVSRFFAHERAEIADFRKAVRQFATDLPAILTALRDLIAGKRAASSAFAAAEAAFLDHAQGAINPAVSADDVQEMLIQHVLTEDIFAKVFENPDFHRQNNIARELYRLEAKLFGPGERARLLQALRPYYAGIQSTAALIESHSEKQGFLKALYENFYKVYNPLAADRLGVVYTPGEIVRFMIRSADWMCERHFGKSLIDRGVEILDPATGTGTFIVELLEHFRGDHARLRHKYKEELHANEVAILPYYVANLNIEATYAAITGQFAEYENLCFVDTLDNVAALGKYAGYQGDMFGGTSDENMGRIKRQNERRISVIIGNPPYNSWQESYNSRNANRPYLRVDARIKQTYIEEGSAQNQNSVYDMYTRFVRWASDRLGDEGVICFVMGRKPIAKAAYDGFRKVVAREFSDIWVMDLGGDVRDNPKLAGTTHNVFGIQTGVAVVILVREKGRRGATIRYARRPEMELKEDKLSFLGLARSVEHLATEQIKPDRNNDWLHQTANDWEKLLPLADPSKGPGDIAGPVDAVFRISTIGMTTQRDEWVWSRSKAEAASKAELLVRTYERARTTATKAGADEIKWDRELDRYLERRITKKFEEARLTPAWHRPFVRSWLYLDPHFNAMSYRIPSMYRPPTPNATIAFRGVASQDPLAVLAIDAPFDAGLVKTGNGRTFGVTRYRYTKSGERVDNITDWALSQFRTQYEPKQETRNKKQEITCQVNKDNIFLYVYAVLHDPVYRETYALNLKREFPRILFYPDFAQWAAWGERLLDLHIGYETVEPYPLTRVDTPSRRAAGTHPKPKLKPHPDQGLVIVDEDTQLTGIPAEAWDYRLGNRSAIDWVLDQHKEKTPRDPTVAAKFNTYRLHDHKEAMIALIARVVRVSLDTVAITGAMRAAPRDG